MFKKILVGTDGSDTAAKAVARAADLAQELGAELLVVNAHPPGADERARAVLAEAEKLHGSKVGLKPLTREGNPADVLADIAESEKVDLIIVGNKGMAGVSRFFLGSVPNRISHHAPTHLLIVKTT